MRALEVKQNVIYASNESTEGMKYTKELIHTLSELSLQVYQI